LDHKLDELIAARKAFGGDGEKELLELKKKALRDASAEVRNDIEKEDQRAEAGYSDDEYGEEKKQGGDDRRQKPRTYTRGEFDPKDDMGGDVYKQPPRGGRGRGGKKPGANYQTDFPSLLN